MRAPWWLCNGWRPASIWCVLDITARCKIRWICDKHDDAIRGGDLDADKWRIEALTAGLVIDEDSDGGPVFRGRCRHCGAEDEWSGSYVRHWDWWDAHTCTGKAST